MPDSFAQILASGSQDLAALIGLFATDGLERNALATQYGWGTVVACSLSLLGILGLIKSSVKVALGLERCATAGFNLDSMRAMFGFLEEEKSATTSLKDCNITKVKIDRTGMVITKVKRFFAEDMTPMVALDSQWYEDTTKVNLGDIVKEQGSLQNPIVSMSALTACSGATTWLLMVVDAEWSWVKILAIPVFHFCLILLLALPIFYDRQTSRPAEHLTVDRWKAFNGGKEFDTRRAAHPITFNLLQVDFKGGDVIHFQGKTSIMMHAGSRLVVLVLCAACAVGYVCQYAILKSASSRQAL